jgi:hypothetical protein
MPCQGEGLKARCAAQGWQGLCPAGNALPEGLLGVARHAGSARPSWQDPVRLFGQPWQLPRAEPRSGTFEVDHAVALGQPVVGYLDDGRNMQESRRPGCRRAHGRGFGCRATMPHGPHRLPRRLRRLPPDAIAQGERLKACCAAQGWLGLYPLDNALPEGLQGTAARWICRPTWR